MKLLGVGLFLLLGAACSIVGGPGTSEPGGTAPAAAEGGLQRFDLATTDDGVRFDPAAVVAAAEVDGASQAQLDALADGLVGFAEYERAMQTAIGCAQEAGVDVVERGVSQDPGGYPRVDYAVPMEVPGMADEEVDQAFDRCYRRHARMVDMVWQLGHSADPDLQAAKYEALGRCLNDNGVPTGPISEENLGEAVEAALDLLERGGPDCVKQAGL